MQSSQNVKGENTKCRQRHIAAQKKSDETMNVANKHRNRQRLPAKVCFVLFQINKHIKLCRPSIPELSLEFQCYTVQFDHIGYSFVIVQHKEA